MTEVEEPIYPDILAEVPGLVLESDLADDSDAVMTPAPPTIEDQADGSLRNAGITADADDDRKITGVHGQITGVDNVFFPVTPSTTQEAHVNQRVTPSTKSETHVFQRITPPCLLRQ